MMTDYRILGAAVLLAGIAFGSSADAGSGEGCDNGVPVGGTACANQGEGVQYRCQPGSRPGQSKWAQESCNGGTCVGAACTNGGGSPPPGPEGCDNGVKVGGTACAHQGEGIQYRCQPGSRPGQSKWAQESCNGGTCVGAACTNGGGSPPPGPEGCDNGVKVGGTACAHQGEGVQYRCQPGSRPGQSKWAQESCNGGTCVGAACTKGGTPTAGCDGGIPIGGTTCLNPGDLYQHRCLKGSAPGKSKWEKEACKPGEACRAWEGRCSSTQRCLFVGKKGECSADGSAATNCVDAPGGPIWQTTACGGANRCIILGADLTGPAACTSGATTCDGAALGTGKCETEGGRKVIECALVGNEVRWNTRFCAGSRVCQGGACVPPNANCYGAPLGSARCFENNGLYQECRLVNVSCSETHGFGCPFDSPEVDRKAVWVIDMCESGAVYGKDKITCINGTCEDPNHLPPAGPERRRWSPPKLAFASAGPLPAMTCTRLLEAADLAGTWDDNYLCSDVNIGMRWSSAGPIPGMKCTQINEPAEPPATTWNDNYLCIPKNIPLTLQWSYAGPIAGKTCVAWNEAADPHTWADNFLCYSAGNR